MGSKNSSANLRPPLEPRHADLGARDLAELLGLLAGEQRRHLVVQALALGELLQVGGVGQVRGRLRALLLGLLDFVECRRVLVGERDQDVVLDLGELVDDLGLGLLLGQRDGQLGADVVERPDDRRGQLGLAGEEVVGQVSRRVAWNSVLRFS